MADLPEKQGQSFKNVLLSLAAFVIIIAGMYFARDLIVPILLSAFIAIICSLLYSGLKVKKYPGFLLL